MPKGLTMRGRHAARRGHQKRAWSAQSAVMEEHIKNSIEGKKESMPKDTAQK